MKLFTTLFVLFTSVTSARVSAVPKLSSLITARATIFLDFYGHYVVSTIWNGGNPLNCAPSGMNDNQETEIFNRVSEDYRPFNVNITTDSTIFLAAPLTKRIRIIVTTTSDWYAGVGGVAFVGSFTWGDDTPAFVFTNRLGPFNPKMVAEACSHEGGHTLGLSHQSKYDSSCTLIATYNYGNGSGEIGWAPIMGNSYYKNHTGWSNGPTPGGCNSLQDNLAIIAANNGFTYRTDDHTDDAGNNPTPIEIVNKAFSSGGIIATSADKDVFQLDIPQTGLVHFSAMPFSVGANNDGADLDIKITVLNSLMQQISVYNPADLLNVVFDTTLFSGRYYIVLDGTGNSYSTSYGSLGSYTITGTFMPLNLLPIGNVCLRGRVEEHKHNLTWNIVSGEAVKSVDIESSTDAIHFKTLTNFSSGAKEFSYEPPVNTVIFYRVKVISFINEILYSNVIDLSSGVRLPKLFTISTIVHADIVVNALKDYTYLLCDANGLTIAKGSNSAGFQRITVNNRPNGIYILQIISEGKKVTERIIKQ